MLLNKQLHFNAKKNKKRINHHTSIFKIQNKFNLMLSIWPHTQITQNTMTMFETWEDQEIQFDLSVKYVFFLSLE